MPLIRSQKKSVRQSLRRRVFNDRRRRAMKRALKKVRAFLSEGKVDLARDFLPETYKAIDKAAKRGVIKKNTAARKKSKIAQLIKKFDLERKEEK